MNKITARSLCVATLVVGYLSLLITGCAITSGTEASGKVVENNRKAELNKSIVINNRGLASDIEITDMRSTFVGKMLKVQVSLRSNNRDTTPIQYKFNWLDVQGFEINANQAWKPFMVYGKETKTIQGVAPDPRAKEFKLKIRDPDSADDY
ncbi:MAG: YcfL family protein [Desulfuromonadales bacterium]|nr:YcfL family protein [Desulfuromonadales bacterium]